jgi:hypothetical protein
MNRNIKTGVFISHITEEKAAANKLKSLIRQAFGKDFSVFVSSDYVSIPGGDLWFTKIVDSLKAVKVVLVLLSEQSVDRRWINFEAGIGLGAEAKVIPIVFRNFEKGDVGVPLSELQVRNLHDPKDVKGILSDIGNQVGAKPRPVDEELFIEELLDVEKNLPLKGVQLEPFLEYKDQETIYLHFRLLNKGNKDVELIELWTSIPNRIRKPDWSPMPVPPALMVENESVDGEVYIIHKYIAGVEPARTGYYRPDFMILPRLMPTSMFPFFAKELRFVLKCNLSKAESSETIKFKVHARGASSFGELMLKDIEGFKS